MLKIAALCLLAINAVRADDDVLVWTDSDFADKVKEHEVALVEFYAPWCGHCKKLAPEYDKAATTLKKNDPPVTLAKVDCTAEKTTCDKFGVSGFPTLKIFRNGEMSADYDGPREANGIVKYMRGQVGPSSKELTSVKDLEKFIDNEEHAVIGFFAEDSKLKDSFQKVADTERDRFRFAHTSNKAVIDKYGFTDDIVVFAPKRLHNKFEEDTLRYDGNYDTDKIKKFLNSEMLGLCGVRTRDTAPMFGRPLVTVYYNVDYVKDPKGTNYWRNRVLKVAQDFKRKMHFAVASRDEFSSEIDEYGLGAKKEQKDKPIVAAQGPNGEKYPMEADFSVENLKKFVEDVLAGKLEAHMKSEPIPDNSSPGVKTLVAKNYKELIADAEADALIEFYAPWCGHCKNLAPTWDELGEKLGDDDSIIIAKMDATANDVPPMFSVSGFPTIYWLPKNDKKNPQPYRGGRDLKDLLKFVAGASTDGLKKYDREGKKKKSEL